MTEAPLSTKILLYYSGEIILEQTDDVRSSSIKNRIHSSHADDIFINFFLPMSRLSFPKLLTSFGHLLQRKARILQLISPCIFP